MPAAAILLIDADKDAGGEIATQLRGLGYEVEEVPDAAKAMPRLGEQGLVILDAVPAGASPIDVCGQIHDAPAMASIPILVIGQSDDVEERIRLLEAGADDVIAKPFDSRELAARIEALLLRFQRSRDHGPGSGDGAALLRNRTVAVFSPKGGVGTTTIAVNVAVNAAQARPDRTVLVDLDLQFGVVSSHLNLDLKQTLADVIRDDAALREPELLRTYTALHSSGLRVLGAPPTPDVGAHVSPNAVQTLLRTLLAGFDSVVVDAGSTLDERSMVAFEAADTVVIPVYPEIPALKSVHALIDHLNELGSIAAKTMFVLNNQFAREILKPRDIEAALGRSIAIDLPYDPFIFLRAANEGIPVVLGAPKSPAADQFARLTATVFNDGVGPAAATPDGRRRGLLGGLRRRS
ncbi:MAG: CpaE family protein [Chloroflexota bacterium]